MKVIIRDNIHFHFQGSAISDVLWQVAIWSFVKWQSAMT